MSPGRPLKVCIDARLVPGEAGGIEMFVAGLARGIREMGAEGEEYHFLVRRSIPAWLEEHTGPEARFLVTRRSPLDLAVAATARAPRLRRAVVAGYKRVRGVSPTYAIRRSDGVVEAAGVEVVHFPFQGAFMTDVPSIYHPHDLQHIHLPEMFTARERRARDKLYRVHCQRASLVPVASEWIGRDVIEQYGLPSDKVVVVPLAPAVQAAPTNPEQVRSRYRLPGSFLLYPAQTWPHKNHLRLIEALSLLHGSGRKVGLVCPGKKTSHLGEILRRVEELGLSSFVSFPGFVPDADLAALYRLAAGAVVPSLFEAASFPIWEAFAAGVPVAASNATSLPEQIGDAGLVFDGNDPRSMAMRLESLLGDAALRATLIERGRRRVEKYQWARTARHFRALYRTVGRVPLTAEDLETLRAAPVF